MYQIHYMYFYSFLLDENINSCKLPTISNINEATTSNNTMIEWLNEHDNITGENDNITDESMHEDDVLNVSIKIYH